MDYNSFYKKCTQCPRECNINRTEKCGFCGEKAEIKIATACLHFGEEPLVTVFGGSGAIFFTGCTLRCSFCQNYQISQQGMGSTVSKDDFVKLCLTLQNAGAENINLITGSHIIPLLAEFLKAAKDSGVQIPFCWNSSSFEKVEMLELLKGLVSVWLPDLKTLDSKESKTLMGAENYPDVAKKAITWMIKNNPLKITTKKNKDGDEKEKIESGVIIRHLFLPGHFEDTVNVLEYLKQNADGKAIISLMSQYTPVPFKENEKDLSQRKKALLSLENRLVNKEEDADLHDIIDAFDFDYLFYQDLSTDTDWLPDFNRIQPFSNALAKPFWHWSKGFLN